MKRAGRLNREQRRILAGMGAAALLTAAAFASSEWLFGSLVPPLRTTADRIAFVIRADLLVAGTLAMCIAAVAYLRFCSGSARRGSAFPSSDRKVAVASAVLQNTLEQAALALMAHLALATLLRGPQMALIPVLSVLFCLGRFFFALGYTRGVARRAFGFGVTFYPSVAALILSFVLVVA